jgi:hypothetical protein
MDLLAACCLLVSWLAYSLTMKVKPVDFQWAAWRYSAEVVTLPSEISFGGRRVHSYMQMLTIFVKIQISVLC